MRILIFALFIILISAVANATPDYYTPQCPKMRTNIKTWDKYEKWLYQYSVKNCMIRYKAPCVTLMWKVPMKDGQYGYRILCGHKR